MSYFFIPLTNAIFLCYTKKKVNEGKTLKRCKNCGRQVMSTEDFCRYCGEPKVASGDSVVRKTKKQKSGKREHQKSALVASHPRVKESRIIRKSQMNLFFDAVCVAFLLIIVFVTMLDSNFEEIRQHLLDNNTLNLQETGSQTALGGNFLIENGELVLYSGKEEEIVIPSGVVKIGEEAFYRNPYIRKVTIPSSVEVIGKEAFSTCPSLETVVFSEGLQEIQSSAFSYCTSLVEVTLPSSVTEMGEYAFADCKKLTYLTISPNLKEIPEGAFQNMDAYFLEIPEGVESIGNGAFYGAVLADGVKIPSTLSYVDYMAFGNTQFSETFVEEFSMVGDGILMKYHGEQTYLTLPEEVKSVAGGAFTGTNVEGIVIPSSVHSIGGGAFLNSKLVAIEIPDSVVRIGDFAFLNSYDLERVHFFTENTVLGQSVFTGTSWLRNLRDEFTVSEDGVLLHYGGTATSLVIPSFVKAIGGGAFEDSTVEKLTIPDTVERIEAFAFLNGTNLTSVTLPSHLDGIEMGMFQNCSSLTSIIIPETVTWIGEGAFQGCGALDGIVIPKAVEVIGVSAFHECYGLRHVELGDGLKRIANHTFAGLTHLETVLIGNSVVTIGNGAFAGCTALVNLHIGDSVATIGQSAFASCSSLTSLTYPSSLLSIEAYAFAGCVSMKDAILNKGIVSIGVEAFARCASLETMEIPSTVLYIGTDMFVDSALYYVVISMGSMADAWIKEQKGDFRVLYV